jgi:hypothetical protein
MSADANDIFRAWTDLTLAGVRAYSSAVLAGLEMAALATQPAATISAPAVHRTDRPREMWPSAGSFGGGTNAVAAWADAASTMMGLSPQPTPAWPGSGFNPFAWMMPAQPPMPPWFAGMMTPAAFAPMAMWGRPFGMPAAIPGFGWPMPAWGPSPIPAPSFSDPFGMLGMMAPMRQPFLPSPQRTSRYH